MKIDYTDINNTTSVQDNRDYRMFRRGTVWWVNLGERENTSVQCGERPCVVISSIDTVKLGIVTVLPLSTKRDKYSNHIDVCVKKDGAVLCEHAITIDVSAITDFVGELSKEEMQKVDEMIIRQYTNYTVPSVESSQVVSNSLDNVSTKLDRICYHLETLCKIMRLK